MPRNLFVKAKRTLTKRLLEERIKWRFSRLPGLSKKNDFWGARSCIKGTKELCENVRAVSLFVKHSLPILQTVAKRNVPVGCFLAESILDACGTNVELMSQSIKVIGPILHDMPKRIQAKQDIVHIVELAEAMLEACKTDLMLNTKCCKSIQPILFEVFGRDQALGDHLSDLVARQPGAIIRRKAGHHGPHAVMLAGYLIG